MRTSNTYRGYRRNHARTAGHGWKAIWHRFYHDGFNPKRVRQSFISKAASKYMPHDNGGKFIKSVSQEEIRRKTAGAVSRFAGMAYHQIQHTLRNMRGK